MFQRLPIAALAQVKGSYTSENLQNEIYQIIFFVIQIIFFLIIGQKKLLKRYKTT